MRPLTTGMTDLLFNIFYAEQNNLPPLRLHEQRHATGLLVRGLATVQRTKIEDKFYDCIVPTKMARTYFKDNIDKNQLK